MTPPPPETEKLNSIISVLKSDYERFPKNQTYDIYAEDVYFKDPTSEFRGLARYRKTIAFIDRWFRTPVLTLHSIKVLDNEPGDRADTPSPTTIRTDWTLTWTTPLPWQPRISIAGWSELGLNNDYAIASHIDYWHCTLVDVITQHFPWGSPSAG